MSARREVGSCKFCPGCAGLCNPPCRVETGTATVRWSVRAPGIEADSFEFSMRRDAAFSLYQAIVDRRVADRAAGREPAVTQCSFVDDEPLRWCLPPGAPARVLVELPDAPGWCASARVLVELPDAPGWCRAPRWCY